ncbi:hypothetical protein [Streptomyces sp. NBC_01334]|uniref:hypothetical protein n=1 Tax=Streptomyces sp. NBC_01334 TaxID=2903827 RepID=UPI002E118CD9|nr:hypothetical protein OG736_27555 [Streptomyces sp. NBC_01334]
MGPSTYAVYYTVQAAEARDRLDDQQRTSFGKGIALLARDPFLSVSRPIGSTGDRTIRLTQNTLVEHGQPRTPADLHRRGVQRRRRPDHRRLIVARRSAPRWKRQDNDRHPVGSVIYARRPEPATLIA